MKKYWYLTAVAMIATIGVSSSASAFTLNDLIKKASGGKVDVLASLNGQKASQYPSYANGLELLTSAADSESGISKYIVDAIRTKYANNDDAIAAGVGGYKVKAEVYKAVFDGAKMPDSLMRKMAAADECSSRVIGAASQTDASEGFEWESGVWDAAFPPDFVAISENLKMASVDYARLQNAAGQQFEARKGKLQSLPKGLRQTCALAGVNISAAGKLSREEQVEKDGSPSADGIQHAMHRLFDASNSAVVSRLQSSEKLSCSKDGSAAYACDVRANVKNLFYAPPVPGTKQLPPGENFKQILGTYRLVWSSQSTEWLAMTR